MRIGPFQLYDYQVRGLELARQAVGALPRPARVVVVAPTGAGKTVIALALIQLAVEKGSRVGFITSGRQLILQMARTMEKAGVPFSVLMAQCDYRHDPTAQVQLVSKDTLQARPDELGVPPTIWIVDEADVCLSEKWQALLSTAPVVIGFTATPCRSNGKGMGPFYQDLVEVACYSELLNKERLCPVRCFAPYQPDLKGVSTTSTGDYDQRQLSGVMNADMLVGDIYRWWKEITKGERPTFVFTVDVEHAVHVSELFNGHGVAAEWVSGTTEQEERDRIFAAMEDGSVRVVASCGVLTRGVDVPAVSCGVLAKPTRSLRQYLQMVGRIVRTHQSKSDAILIDHAGAVVAHGWPTQDRDWNLNPRERIEDREKKQEPGETLRSCPQCGVIWEHHASKLCPNCGYERTRRGVATKMADGTYKEMSEKDTKQAKEVSDERVWKQCLGIAANRNMSVAQAQAIYCKRQGRYPDGLHPTVERSDRHRKVANVFPNYCRKKAKP